MSDTGVTVTFDDAHQIATIELNRPPENYFSLAILKELSAIYASLEDDAQCRAIVLCSQGKHFCAGANFSSNRAGPTGALAPSALYDEAVHLFEGSIPVVAAVQGAAIGGGLGLACSADFRVASADSRFSANFARLGFHQGFGLTVTLPAVIGNQRALELLYTGRRVGGEEAFRMGLCDRLVANNDIRLEAVALAEEIAESAPLAVRSIRQTMRGHLAEAVRVATVREASEQDRLRTTSDWTEGVRAVAERRAPHFEGR